VLRQGDRDLSARRARGPGEAGQPPIANRINYAFPIGSRVRVSFHDRKVILGKIRFER
jgi:hypothetical protein